VFDDGWVQQRKDLGYRRLSQRCWDAHLAEDLPALLELAADPQLTPDLLATIAPLDGDLDVAVELIYLVLAHPACGPGVAGRFATHHDPEIRLRVARFPGLVTSTLGVLTVDPDPEVRAAAVTILTARAATMTDR
jgi:hypothetical protein